MKKLFFFLLLVPFCAQSQSDTALIRKHLTALTKTPEFRNYENVGQLQDIAAYLHNEFLPFADTVFFQPFKIGERLYTNVIASFGTENSERIIIGAHYDVCGNQEGADDNASGVTGLLEIARQLKDRKLSKRIDLVAYTLEEPPFFKSEFMGSRIHAQSLVDDSINVVGMICLEMIGYFADGDKTQDYPLKFLSWIYGKRGDYITVVNKFSPGKFARSFAKRFKDVSLVKAKRFKGPKGLQGIDFSDHASYWEQGFSAVMVTDTAFYRNNNYHETGDTMEKLDLFRMAQVIDAVLLSLDID